MSSYKVSFRSWEDCEKVFCQWNENALLLFDHCPIDCRQCRLRIGLESIDFLQRKEYDSFSWRQCRHRIAATTSMELAVGFVVCSTSRALPFCIDTTSLLTSLRLGSRVIESATTLEQQRQRFEPFGCRPKWLSPQQICLLLVGKIASLLISYSLS